jgi:hypothetical protein
MRSCKNQKVFTFRRVSYTSLYLVNRFSILLALGLGGVIWYGQCEIKILLDHRQPCAAPVLLERRERQCLYLQY